MDGAFSSRFKIRCARHARFFRTPNSWEQRSGFTTTSGTGCNRRVPDLLHSKRELLSHCQSLSVVWVGQELAKRGATVHPALRYTDESTHAREEGIPRPTKARSLLLVTATLAVKPIPMEGIYFTTKITELLGAILPLSDTGGFEGFISHFDTRYTRWALLFTFGALS